MKFPLTILFLLVFALLIQGTVLYGWLSHNLFFTLEKMGSFSLLGLGVSGFALAYFKVLSSATAGFWSIKTIFILLLQLVNFAVFFGIGYLVLTEWLNVPEYIGM
jgi:hypothetical protein